LGQAAGKTGEYILMQVFLNDHWLPLEEAKVPVLDRGFIFGDGIYEVLPVYDGRVFRIKAHLRRLFRSLEAIGIANPYDAAGWQAIIERLVAQSDSKNLSVYLQITRGMAPRDHAFPDTPPTVFAMANPLPEASPTLVQEGVKAIVLDDIRWLLCDIKATSLLANVLLRQKAVESDAKEAILIRDGFLTEGAASSVFIVQDGKICLPPFAPTLLPGVTSALIVSLARHHRMPFGFRPISEKELRGADEIWLTSSIREMLPVVVLDGVSVGSGQPGPIFWQMHHLYQAAKQLPDEALDQFFRDFLNHA
jgi:D-alanine transaminase